MDAKEVNDEWKDHCNYYCRLLQRRFGKDKVADLKCSDTTHLIYFRGGGTQVDIDDNEDRTFDKIETLLENIKGALGSKGLKQKHCFYIVYPKGTDNWKIAVECVTKQFGEKAETVEIQY